MDWKETTKPPEREPVREFKADIGDVRFSATQEPWGWHVSARRGGRGTADSLTSIRDDRDAATHEVVRNARKLGWIE